jgi:pseudouridine kinase
MVVRPAARERIVCVGNAALDRTFALADPARPATSNPARMRTGFGGVARNVAENLARLDVVVSLVTQVGDDAGGRALRDDCAARGIDVRGVLLSTVHPTSEYAAIVDPHGELVIAASANAAIEALAAGQLGAALPDDSFTAWMFADCNLSPAVLAALLEDRRAGGPRLAIDADNEARALLGAGDELDAVEVARGLRGRGADAVVLTRGARGAVVASGEGTLEIAVPPARPVDVTGAGDALIAGTLYGLAGGETLPDAVRTGTLVALLTIESATPVSRELTRVALAALRDRVPVRA